MGSRARSKGRRRRQSGVALFMVLATIGVLSLLVSEFVYVAQVNQRMAFDGVDQLKAHYLAKSGLKISLLRLKAYGHLKDFMSQQGLGALIPKSVLDQVWSFPFAYPIPASLPGLTLTQKDAIEKFQKSSSIDGRFTALIESESSRFNLNSLVMASPKAGAPAATPTATPKPDDGDEDPNAPPKQPPAQPAPAPSPTPDGFNAEEARKNFSEFVLALFQNKMKTDDEFAEEYRDLSVPDLTDAMIAWADPQYASQNQRLDRDYPWKRAPYYSLTELHLLPGMDDTLYGILAPNLTVSPTSGVNVNTLQKPLLHALFPQMTEEELAKFFLERDPSAEGPGKPFSDAEGFFKWLTTNVGALRGDAEETKKLREQLEKRGLRFVADETEFVIRVTSTVNQATRTLEAWVALGTQPTSPKKEDPSGAEPKETAPAAPAPTTPNSKADSGIQLRFMRFL